MNKPRCCGCKGCRTCLICESTFGVQTPKKSSLNKEASYIYCPFCNKIYPGWDVINDYLKHPNHDGEPIDFPGVYIQLNFLNSDEELQLINGVDNEPWSLSQSGRRKQNYGPKCNFKKKKLSMGDFNGFPSFSKFVQRKFNNEVEILKDFKTIEQCSLEYVPERGASIDPHVDDCWIWGERVVTVNLLCDSVLTMTRNKKINYYNLGAVEKYSRVLDDRGQFTETKEPFIVGKIQQQSNWSNDFIVRIPMPRNSLLVLYNTARYDWEHQILREDVKERRVCIAYREFTPPYLPLGEKYKEGENILARAENFF